MRTVTYRLADLPRAVIPIGFVGENEHTRVMFDCKRVFDEYPSAVAALTVQPPYGEAYPAVVVRDGDIVYWDVYDSDLTQEGRGEAQLTFSQGDVVVKSFIVRTSVDRSIVGAGDVPEPLDDFLARAGEALTAIPQTIDDALAAAKASGEFDGADGQDGQDGQDGADGFSPTVNVTEISGGHQVAVTDAEGTTTFDVMDGQDGSDGEPGADGFSPRATVSKSGKVATITITDAAGTTTAQISDGEDGQGEDVIDDTAGAGDTDKTFSADKLVSDHNSLLNAINVLQPTATSGDVGKFLKAKTVADGKVTAYEFGEGGGGGTDDYNDLTNKPQIGGVTLVGNKSASDLGLLAGQNVTSAVDTYLEANFSNPSNPPLDRSLSSSLSAAPADVTGGIKTKTDTLEAFCKKDIVAETKGNISVTSGTVVQTTTHLVDVNIPSGKEYVFKIESTELITKFHLYENGTNIKYNCTPGTEYTITAGRDVTYISIYCNTTDVVGSGTITGVVRFATQTSNSLEERVDNLEDNPQITPAKTTFFKISQNLVDPSATTDGAYVNQTTGAIGYLAGEMVTDFIPVDGSTTYCITNFNNSTNFYCRYAFYTASKTFISGEYAKVDTGMNDKVTSPSNAAWMRFSATNTNFPMMIAKGNQKPLYDPYGNDYVLPKYIVDTDEDSIVVNLPKKVYAFVGLETNIYFENIVEDWTKYQWNVDCDVGMQLERGYRITPVAGNVGTHTIDIYIKASDKVTKKVSTTLIVSATSAGSGDTVKLIVLGDSTTDAGTPIEKLHANFEGDSMTVQTIGTRGTAPNNMEGRSGWTLEFYFTKASITYTDERGTIYNPFYNPTSQTFDASYYFTNSGVDEPDWFFINLGINDMFNYTSEGMLESGIETAIGRIDAMIDSLQNAVSGIKIGVCLTIPPNVSQDAFGKAYACGQSRDQYKHNNMMWVNALIEEYDDREEEGIYLVPIHASLDVTNNMGLETIAVNARNPSVTYASPIGNGGVHPSESGYWQIADVYTAFLKGNA